MRPARPAGAGQVGQRQHEDHLQQGAGAFQPGRGQHGVVVGGRVAGQDGQGRGERRRGGQYREGSAQDGRPRDPGGAGQQPPPGGDRTHARGRRL